jgi:NitT/TauT family transport system substrate-binding protein
MTRARVALIALAGWLALAVGARAETIKVGLLKTVGAGPIFIAEEKGYFAAEGLEVQNVVFDSAEPIAKAVIDRRYAIPLPAP